MPYDRLPESVLTLYAELLEQSIHAEAEQAIGELPSGSFVHKQIRDRTYWYLQRSEGSRKRQIYLGPESPALVAWMDRVRRTRSDRAEEVAGRARLCAMLTAGGVAFQSAPVMRVLELLAEAGIFRLGGVLVGTYAFAAYANMLGVRFDHQALRTQDIDIAQDPVIGIGLLNAEPAVDVADKLVQSGMSFYPVPSLDPRCPSIS